MIPTLIVLALVIIGLLIWHFGREQERPSRDILLGKTFGKILDGERDEVLEEMRQLYGETQQDVGIGLALGILLRHLGKNQAAIRTHRSLMTHTHLETDLKALILTELAADYLSSGLLDRARSALEEALALKPQDELMTRFGERIFYRLKDWDAAFQLVQTYGKRSGKQVSSRLAMIRNEQGAFLAEEGDVEAGHQFFKKAISIDPECLPAYLNRARFLREQGLAQKALKHMLKKYEYFKNQAWLALNELKACALALNQPQVLLEPLKKHLEEEPDDWRAMCVYAGFETDSGNYEAAADWYMRALRVSPQTLIIHQRLWSVMLRGNMIESLLRDYQAQVREDLVFSSAYECQGCHFHSTELLWRCPSCFRQYSFRERAI